MNVFLFLGEFLCIFLATNSLPEPDGPHIKTLLSVKEISEEGLLTEVAKSINELPFFEILTIRFLLT